MPPAPTGLSAIGGDGVADLTWEAPSGNWTLSGYDIFRALDTPVATTGTPYATVSDSTTAYQDPAATNGTTYYYAVVARNIVGVSEGVAAP